MAALALTGYAQPLHAETRTWFGFQVGVSGGNAPPPVVFRGEPRVAAIGDVEVVQDERCRDDVFRTGDLWWRMSGGYWYRAASWRGPWVSVDVRRVPERVLVVPARHWKHHPRETGRNAVAAREEENRHGRQRGHDDGRDHRDQRGD